MLRKVLIIDDDSGVLYIVNRWLSALEGLSISTAGTGAVAMAEIARGDWDLVISDVYLPDSDGIIITQSIRRSNPHCNVLLMTGHFNLDVALRAVNVQIQGLMTKPLKKHDFLSKVQELLNASGGKKRAKPRKILAIGAHPDDVEIGCGGILLRHRNHGDEVHILTLSSGERGGQVSQRAEEAQQASQQIGARLFLHNLADTNISANGETISIIESVIQECSPSIIYTHSLHDNHQDHRNAHLASMVAARRVPRVECYQSPSSTIDFHPSRFVDITDELEEKVALIACYASQFSKCPYLSESLIEATAEYWGRFADYRKVEPLEVVRCE